MNYRGHRNTSLVIAFPVMVLGSLSLSLEVGLICGVLTFLGGMFPDLDTNSTPSKWAARVGVILSVIFLSAKNPAFATYAAYIGILFMLAKTDKHRGWTHSKYIPLSILSICLILGLGYKFDLINSHFETFIFYLPYCLSFAIGITSHLFADSKLVHSFNKH